MARLALLLVTLCAVKVSANPTTRKVKTTILAATTVVGNDTTASKGAGSSPARGSLTTSPWAGRRGGRRQNDDEEYKPKPKKKLRNMHNNDDHSTSSSSGAIKEKTDKKKKYKADDSQQSLEMSGDDTRSKGSKEKNKRKKHWPKSTEERHGWRKWHRKCTRCPDDMKMKWQDPRVRWICGGYQRARRSFKSICMMHYRNCQDGTMFTMIHEHRCANASAGDPQPRGEHFFYDYQVVLSEDSSETTMEDSTESSDTKSSSSSSSSA